MPACLARTAPGAARRCYARRRRRRAGHHACPAGPLGAGRCRYGRGSRPAHPRRTRLSTTTAMARSGSALPWRTARPATLPARRQVPCCSGARRRYRARRYRAASAARRHGAQALAAARAGPLAAQPGAPPERPPAGAGGMGYAARRPGCLGTWHPAGSHRRWVLLRWCWRRPGSPPISWRMCCPIRAGPARGRHPDIVHGAVRLGVRRLLDGDDGLPGAGQGRRPPPDLAQRRRRRPDSGAARTAVIMPICNEDVTRVFAGLRATYESVVRSGQIDAFDFFVLSDSGNPDLRVAETDAWMEICRAVGGFGRIFYRWRRHRVKRKTGNVADFCRRWGSQYRYMIVLDADSVMSGDCLATLVRLMEPIPAPASSRPRRRRWAARPCTRACSSSPRVSTARCSRRACTTAARRIALLGPQRHHPCEALHGALRTWRRCPAKAAGGRDPVARLSSRPR